VKVEVEVKAVRALEGIAVTVDAGEELGTVGRVTDEGLESML
jgi:hypothetical protein